MTALLHEIDPQSAWAPFQPSADQPFDEALAAHLYRRAGFGGSTAELKEAAALGPQGAAEKLLNAGESEDDRTTAEHLVAAALAGGDVQNGAAAWLHRLVTSPAQVREKMTLFWHGHFATGAEKVQDLQLMQQQNDFLRKHALGDFRQLTQGISRDPAMLIYLDSATNRKSHPNENYARELMELFCLGEGNYTERDVLELARCFTGWGVKRRRYKFNTYQHDTGEKEILGKRGPWSGEQAVDIVLGHSAVEQFITAKLVRFFVMDEPAADARLLAPLAETFRNADLNVLPVLQQIFTSNLFYSDHAIGRKVRSPVELAVGLLRCFEGATNVVELSKKLKDVGHGLYYPPNVKGWDGGRTWINTSTLLGRANLVGDMLANKSTRFAGDGLDELAKSNGALDVSQAIQWISSLMLVRPSDEVHQQLSKVATAMDDEQLRRALHTMAAMPQCQLG